MGRLECFHSTLKAMISICITAKHDWPVVLDLVLYFTRNTPPSFKAWFHSTRIVGRKTNSLHSIILEINLVYFITNQHQLTSIHC